jgi:hypothetical protein
MRAREGKQPEGGGDDNRDITQAYVKMSAKEKETLKWSMVEINEAAAGNKENTPPSLIPK